jgi:hypothetical protein
MKRWSHQLFLIFVVTLVTIASFSKANESEQKKNACRCIFNGTKDYQVFDEKKSWFGQRMVHRQWTCQYTCEVGSVSETVVGSYKLTNYGDDNGLEGICEGTVYESQFNSFVNREVYSYKSTESFNPKKGKAPELKQWAESHECDSGSWLN